LKGYTYCGHFCGECEVVEKWRDCFAGVAGLRQSQCSV
jgi:hypothetical protein